MNMFLLVAVTHSSELSLLVLNSRAAALELLWQCEIALTSELFLAKIDGSPFAWHDEETPEAFDQLLR